MALGRLAETGSSELPWSVAEERLADLIAEFGPATGTSRRQSAAYPFTRLRTDGVWTLSRDVPMDNVGPLDAAPITGRLEACLERALSRPGRIEEAARLLVDAQFPRTVAPDVLIAVGLDPDQVFAIGSAHAPEPGKRQRSSSWPRAILEAWDRQCAFCGYDGQLGSSSVGLEAAHVRWFNLGGPDDLDNGMALCSLHQSCLTVARSVWTRSIGSSSRASSPPEPRQPNASTTCTVVPCNPDAGRTFPQSHMSPGTAGKSSRASRSLPDGGATPDPSTPGFRGPHHFERKTESICHSRNSALGRSAIRVGMTASDCPSRA
jgi:hypothetical protein